jgi:hypothetical protein
MEIRGEYFKELDNGKTIFYRDTHEVSEFFKTPPKNEFVLISHNSDGNVTRNSPRINSGSSTDCDITSINIPDNLIKWYSQNVDVDHPKIESIPIGIENKCWFPEVQKYEKMMDIKNTKKVYKNLLYINFNINTNLKEREPLYRMFSGLPWVTIEMGGNGSRFDNYLNNIYNHKYVLSPRGNGIDTHRTWETLYVNSIPIEKRNLNNRFYSDLPILFVDDWSQVTRDLLETEFEKLKDNNSKDMLTFEYWNDKILKNLC